MKKKVISFIDGFNVYHSIADDNRFRKYKWLNLKGLSEAFISPSKEELKKVYYFTALYPSSDQLKANRHKTYIKALASVGVETVYGKFKRHDRWCPLCRKHFDALEEKQTDVNIAIYLFNLSITEQYDKALIVSGDSDLIPAIKAVKETFPNKEIEIIIPIGRKSEDLKNLVGPHHHHKIKEKQLERNQFSPAIDVGGTSIIKPKEWC